MAGSGTVRAITSKIWQNVPMISYVSVSENAGGSVDEWGRPPHCVHVVVDGGNASSIAVL